MLIISAACSVFIVGIIALYSMSYSNGVIQFAVELFTIPAILYVVFAFFFSLINVFRKKVEYNLILGLNTITILAMVLATIADYKL